MELELTDDQLELRDSIRTVLEATCPPSFIRTVYESGATADGLWTQMVELYWPAVAIAEELGGLGLGFVELAIVAEELGRATAPGPFLATATQFTPLIIEAGTAEHQQRFVAPIIERSMTGTVAWAERGRLELGAVRTTAERVDSGWVLTGEKSAVLDGSTAEEVAVIARSVGSTGDDGIGVFIVAGHDVVAHPRSTIDPTVAIADIVVDRVVVGADRVLVEPRDARAVPAIERAMEQATVALAMATVGTCRRILETTLEYAKVRVQYDQPIGSFQALKHRFADAFLSVERATSLCYYAALTIAEDDPRRAEAASLAKTAAGECQRLLTSEGLQLHGGIGYTWEHDLHFLLKRAVTGDALLGNAAFHRARLARLLGLDQVAEVADASAPTVGAVG